MSADSDQLCGRRIDSVAIRRGATHRCCIDAITRWAGRNGWPDFAWQSRFCDDIIRDESSQRRIQHYVANNPAKWEIDRYHPTNLQAKGIACGKKPPP